MKTLTQIKQFIDRNFNIILLSLVFIIFLKTCSIDQVDTTKIESKLTHIEMRVDSLSSVSITPKDLKLEGLKNEQRMIQSCDRKIMDVNRQNAIEEEIKKIETNE
jgi:hypothetical protein